MSKAGWRCIVSYICVGVSSSVSKSACLFVRSKRCVTDCRRVGHEVNGVALDGCLLGGTCNALARKPSRASFPYSFAKSRSMEHHHHDPPAIASLHTHAQFSVTSPFLNSPSLCRLPPVLNITCITSRIWQCPSDLPAHSTLARGRISIHSLIRAQYI
jgi:hypothetical protein